MIPAAIQALLPQHPGEENRIGHSGAQVVIGLCAESAAGHGKCGE